MAAQLSAKNGLPWRPRVVVQARAGNDLLAAAGFAFDQHRKRRVGVLLKLNPQLLYRRAVANQGGCRQASGAPFVQRSIVQSALQYLVQFGGIAGFGDKVGGAQGAGVAGVAGIALAGENDDLDIRGQLEQLGNQGESFVRAVRERRQAQVNQREIGNAAQLTQQLRAVRAGMAGDDFECDAHRKAQRVGNQRIIINDEQQRFFQW